MGVEAGRSTERVTRAGERMQAIRAEIGRVIVGQDEMVTRLLIGLVADGHLLLEGVPGLAKTLAVRTLADALSLSFKRIQFTPDLLPADLTGTLVFNPRDGSFSAKRGPVFEVRGAGLLLGLVLEEGLKAATVRDQLLERGVLVGTSNDPRVLRLSPALTLQPSQAARLATAFESLTLETVR